MSNRGNTHATTILSTVVKNLHGQVHRSELVGAWPFLAVRLSLRARCILDMVPGIDLRMVLVAVPILDLQQTVPSFAFVEMRRVMLLEPFVGVTHLASSCLQEKRC